MREQLIMILDAYTLEVVDEHVVQYSLEYISGLDVEPEDEAEYEDPYSDYPTLKKTPTVFVWDKGRYMMIGQTVDEAVSIFQYEILDTQEEEKFVISRERFSYWMIVDVKVSPENNETLYIGGYNNKNTFAFEVNVKNESAKLISTGTSDNEMITSYSIDESCKTQYHSRIFRNTLGKIVCGVYSAGIRENTEINVDQKNKNCLQYDPSFIGKADRKNYVGMEYSQRNDLEVKVSGEVNFKKTLTDLDFSPDISSVKDYGMRGDNGVMIISDFSESSFEVIYVRNK